MNKMKSYHFLYAISLLLFVGFGTCLGADYYRYTTTLNSAPFYLTVLVRMVEFGVPAIAAFVAARILRKRVERTEK